MATTHATSYENVVALDLSWIVLIHQNNDSDIINVDVNRIIRRNSDGDFELARQVLDTVDGLLALFEVLQASWVLPSPLGDFRVLCPAVDRIPILTISCSHVVVTSSPLLELLQLLAVLKTKCLLSVEPDIKVSASLWSKEISYVLG